MNLIQWIKTQAGFPAEPNLYEEYCLEVQHAWDQWQAAQNIFDNVTDHDLVDFAIYDLEAARRRYVYMLRKSEEIAKETNLIPARMEAPGPS